MDARVETALIAGAVSLVVALISFLVARSKIRAELHTLKLQQKHAFIERLYEQRLNAYPEVFEITRDLGRKGNRTPEEVVKTIKAAREKLEIWHSRKSGLFLSRKSLGAYYELLEALKKNPETKTGYSEEQLRKVSTKRNELRWALRDDIGLLHDEE